MAFLDRLVLREGVDIRSPLLDTLIELYLQKPSHTNNEERHFTELASRLLDGADIEARIAAARRLATYPAAPAAIMQRLKADVPEVATLITSREFGTAERTSPAIDPDQRLTASELSDLFFAADADERRLILVNLAYAAPAGLEVTSVAATREVGHQLEAAALARNPAGVMRVIEVSLGISSSLAYRIVRDPLGEPIIAVAKVLELTPDALQRILLFLNPVIGRSVQLVYELSTLFERIEVDSARLLVAVWRAAEPRAPLSTIVPLYSGPGVRSSSVKTTTAAPRSRIQSVVSALANKR